MLSFPMMWNVSGFILFLSSFSSFFYLLSYFVSSWQRKHELYLQVQSAHGARRGHNHLELFHTKDEQLRVGRIQFNGPGSWRARIVGIMG